MTTDPEEGSRQVDAMQPEPLKVGDSVRLKAGDGSMTMTVVGFEDYGNMVVCDLGQVLEIATLEADTVVTPELVKEWEAKARRMMEEGAALLPKRDTFPASSLVRVDRD
jgi:hypothetical protein